MEYFGNSTAAKRTNGNKVDGVRDKKNNVTAVHSLKEKL